MSDPLATVIAALIGAIGTIIATKFDDIKNFFQKPSQKIAGEWEGISYARINDPRSQGNPDEPLDKYTISITQTGEKIKAEMIETEVAAGYQKRKYIWKGKIVSNYFVYESTCDDPSSFLISSAMLYIYPGGRRMSGFFIANSRPGSSESMWIGYAELLKKP